MSQDSFKAGIEPGGLTSRSEVRSLICYLASCYDKPIPKSVLLDALTYTGIANYFDIIESISDLLNAKLIHEEDDGYLISNDGLYVVDALYRELPLTIREKAIEATRQNLLLYYKTQQHAAIIEKIKDGYLVHCSIKDSSTTFFSLSLYAPTFEYAKNIKRNFILNAENIIGTIISQMTSGEDSDSKSTF